MDIEDLFSEWERERQYQKSLHPIIRFFYNTPRAITVVIPRKIRGLKYHIGCYLSRLFTGYAGEDWWEYASRNSRRAVILLEKLRDQGHGIKCSSYPALQGVSFDGEGREEWVATLNDMIFFHKCIAGQYSEIQGGSKIQCDNYHEIKDPQARTTYAKGKLAYFRYYEQLWD